MLDSYKHNKISQNLMPGPADSEVEGLLCKIVFDVNTKLKGCYPCKVHLKYICCPLHKFPYNKWDWLAQWENVCFVIQRSEVDSARRKNE